MKTLNSINIRGPVERIFDLACKVENWPKLLPHYRHVSVISDDGVSRIVEMNCVRDFGPIRWHCQWVARQQIIDVLDIRGRIRPDRHHILVEHLECFKVMFEFIFN